MTEVFAVGPFELLQQKKKIHVKSKQHRKGESKPVLKALFNKTLIIDLILIFFQCPSIEKKKIIMKGKQIQNFGTFGAF